MHGIQFSGYLTNDVQPPLYKMHTDGKGIQRGHKILYSDATKVKTLLGYFPQKTKKIQLFMIQSTLINEIQLGFMCLRFFSIATVILGHMKLFKTKLKLKGYITVASVL